MSVALGAMTLPHGLARVVLAEQFYRAVDDFIGASRTIGREAI